MRSVIMMLLALLASAQAFMLQVANQVGLSRPAISSDCTAGVCPCMSCRTNLKKEKRSRNRINAFRFKKGGFVRRRFNGPDYAAEAKKQEEDNQFFSLIYTYSAEEAAAAEAAAKNAPREQKQAS